MTAFQHYIQLNSTTFSKIFVVLGFVCALTASLTSDKSMEGIPWNYSYYHLNAIAFSFYLIAFYLLTISNTPKWSKRWRAFVLFVVLCSLTTIGDEIAGTATQLGLHDLIRLLAVLVIFVMQRYKILKKCMKFLKR
jgi:hypothetical protein